MDNGPDIFHEWLRRKLNRKAFQPEGELVLTRKWERHTGRVMFGTVTLRVSPSGEFRYTEQVQWPDRPEAYSRCVLDGILDALMIDLGVAPGGHFVLESAEFRSGESVPYAYGAAAREAVSELFGMFERDRLGVSDGHAV